LKEGGEYTKYFPQSQWKEVQNNGEDILGESEIIKLVTDFYKTLFGPSPISSRNLDGIECNQVTEEDRLELIKPFDLEEIKEVVFELKHNKAVGADGLPAEFYQTF
jgi:hypothetical protein